MNKKNSGNLKFCFLQTARAGSKSVEHKNILKVGAIPLYEHNIRMALGFKDSLGVYITTDCDYIKSNAPSGAKIIDRPRELCQDDSSHQETMQHGLLHIEKELGHKLDAVFILLGNSVPKSKKDMENALEILRKDEKIDSVICLSKFNMFNPYRCFRLEGNRVKPFIKKGLVGAQDISDKNAMGDFYYYNGGFQLCRRSSILGDGSLVYPWLGENVHSMVQDFTMEVDATWQLDILKLYEKPEKKVK